MPRSHTEGPLWEHCGRGSRGSCFWASEAVAVACPPAFQLGHIQRGRRAELGGGVFAPAGTSCGTCESRPAVASSLHLRPKMQLHRSGLGPGRWRASIPGNGHLTLGWGVAYLLKVIHCIIYFYRIMHVLYITYFPLCFGCQEADKSIGIPPIHFLFRCCLI